MADWRNDTGAFLKDLSYIMNPGRWTLRNVCPVIREREGAREEGVIFAFNVCEVKLINLYFLPKTIEEIKALYGIKYNSVEDMLFDGWQVD